MPGAGPGGELYQSDMALRLQAPGVDAGTGKRFASRSISIGCPADHSPDAARVAANVHKGLAKAGGDPAAIRKRKIADDAARRARTVDRLLEAYIKDVPKRMRLRGSGIISDKHAREEISHVSAAVAAMRCRSKSVADVGVSDLRRLLRADPEHPNAARHRFGAISRFFDWCQDDGLLQVNPCNMVAKARRPRAPASRASLSRPRRSCPVVEAGGRGKGVGWGSPRPYPLLDRGPLP